MNICRKIIELCKLAIWDFPNDILEINIGILKSHRRNFRYRFHPKQCITKDFPKFNACIS